MLLAIVDSMQGGEGRRGRGEGEEGKEGRGEEGEGGGRGGEWGRGRRGGGRRESLCWYLTTLFIAGDVFISRGDVCLLTTVIFIDTKYVCLL